MKLLRVCAATVGVLHAICGATVARPGPSSLSSSAATESRQSIPESQQTTRETAERAFAAGELARLEGTPEGWRTAVTHLREAARLFSLVDDHRRHAESLLTLSSAHFNLGELQAMLDDLSNALQAFRRGGDRGGEVQTLNRLANVHGRMGADAEAIALYQDGIALSDAIGDHTRAIAVRFNVATAHESVGDSPAALRVLHETRDIARRIEDRRAEAEANRLLGRLYRILGRPDEALTHLGEALALAREVSYRATEAATHLELGRLRALSGEFAAADEHFQATLAIGRETDNPTRVLVAKLALGELHGRAGDYAEALHHLREAHTLANGRNPGIKAAIQLASAQVARGGGDLSGAQQAIEAALAIIESTRGTIRSDDLRASYASTSHRYFDFYVDLLMQRHQREPLAGYDAQALRAVERARARSLLELLSGSHVSIREGVDPALLERERALQLLLDDASERLIVRAAGPRAATDTRTMEKRFEQLRDQHREVLRQIDATSPRYSSLTQPQPLMLNEIQAALLDKDTLLLEYALGDARSFLFVVSHTGLATYVLPSRAAIEAAARRVHHAYAARGQGPLPAVAPADNAAVNEALQLSDLIVRPAAALLQGQRLVIVPDGALHYIPFAALPDPRDPLHPLILKHEVVNLPSASVLAVLRRDSEARSAARRTAIVFADPVFDREDPRVAGRSRRADSNGLREPARQSTPAPTASALERSSRDVGLSQGAFSIPRLPFTRREAAAIVETIPRGQTRLAIDFDASRATATSGNLTDYRIVHFATHGLLNTDHPELSGLVLSLVDRKGERQNGFLRLTDIFNLRLGADLVVLSGCQTGLGKELHGEGLIGLTRGFMYAGAPRVIATLWKVDDRATAELMRRAYEAMLGDPGRSPAAALRAAQIALLEQKRFRSPYYWAGFALQGDWR